MLYLGLLLVFSISGVLMQEQSSDESASPLSCAGTISADQMERAVHLNFSKSELKSVCRNVIKYLRCMDDAHTELHNMPFQEMAHNRYGPPHLVRTAQAFVNLTNIFQALCVRDSNYQEAFKHNAKCLSSLKYEEARKCSNAGERAYRSYMRNRDGTYRRPTCMVQAYKSACLAAKVFEDCGREAYSVYERMMENVLFFELMMCTDYDKEELRDEFLKSLNLEGHDKFLYEKTFKIVQ